MKDADEMIDGKAHGSQFGENGAIVILGLITLVFAWYRLSLGAEMTDEAFYIAEMRFVAKGALPIVELWTQMPGFPIIFSWLTSLHESITGSTEGLFLFMRRAYFVFKILTFIAVFFLLRRYLRPQAIALFLITLIPFSPHNINMFSYNTISLFFQLLAGAILVRIVLCKQDKRSALFLSAGAGGIMALTALAYITQIIIGGIFAAFLFIIFIREKRPLRVPLMYILCGFSTAMLIASGLAIAAGGFDRIFAGLRVILKNGQYFKIPRISLTQEVTEIHAVLGARLWLYALFVLIFVAISIYRAVSGTRHDIQKAQRHSTVLANVYILVLSVYLLFYLIGTTKNNTTPSLGEVLESALFPLPFIVFLSAANGRRFKQGVLLLFLWLPALISLLVVSISNWSGIHGRWYLLCVPAALSLPFLSEMLSQTNGSGILKTSHYHSPSGGGKYRIGGVSGRYGLIALSCLMVTVICLNTYHHIYRDEPYTNLNTRIESGVYKGIRTTAERANGLIALEQTIQNQTAAGETVLFMDWSPFGYLMTDANFCAPTSLDSLFYSYGLGDDAIMQKYFKMVEATPDKIIYIDFGRDEQLSIDAQNYPFNDFVNAYYRETYTDRNATFPVKVYEKINLA